MANVDIVQSLWSKPLFHNFQNYGNSRRIGGWLNIKSLWLSITFSFYSAKRYYSKVHLVTDTEGYEILIKALRLPYDSVTTHLDILRNDDHRLWVLGKLAAIKLQTKPFIHIDNDVYLWQRIPFNSKINYLIAQSMIKMPGQYSNTLKEVFLHFDYIPECVKSYATQNSNYIINAGIIGGNDLEWFQKYCSLADLFVDKNKSGLSKIDAGLFNTILDEYLFTSMAEQDKKKLSFLINVPAEDVFKSIMRFNLVPFFDKYIHLVGHAKQNRLACEQLEYRFRYQFPKEYINFNNAISDIYPAELLGNVENDRWEQIQKGFSVIYSTKIDGLLRKKITLSKHVKIETTLNEQDEKVFTLIVFNSKTGANERIKLKDTDEVLCNFQSPITIFELLEELKAEGFIKDESSFLDCRFKLIDFVTEKIIIEGLLEFVD